MPKTIKLATNLNCLAEPCFIVEKEGALFLALAVLEYDKAQAGGNQKKEEGCDHLRDLFTQGCQNKTFKACAINSDGSLPPPGGGNQPAPSPGELGSAGASTGGGSPGSSAGPGPGGPSGPGGPGGPGGPSGPGGQPPPPPQPSDPPPPPPPPGMQTDPPGMQTSP